MIVQTNPEFGVELALSVPYAYWLHRNDQLKGVVTSTGMTPFYYFCDNVQELFTERTIDNQAAGLGSLPNDWIHGKSPHDKPAVLDYSQWMAPPYKSVFRNNEFFPGDKPMVFISNIYNFEHGRPPRFHFFDVECLYEMFDYLTEQGYAVVYKRPTNRETAIAIDQNERNAAQMNEHITAIANGKVITDRQLPSMMDNVYLFDDLWQDANAATGLSYNEFQLRLLANCERFISVCGGNAIFSCLFGGTTVVYITQGRELRPNYFGPDSYWRKFSGTNVIPVFDVIDEMNNVEQAEEFGHKINRTGLNDYTGLLETIKATF